MHTYYSYVMWALKYLSGCNLYGACQKSACIINFKIISHVIKSFYINNLGFWQPLGTQTQKYAIKYFIMSTVPLTM